MEHEELHPIDRDAARRDLGSGDPERISTALVRLALHEPDRSWVEDLIAEHLMADNLWVRGVAATCAGHVARIHSALDTARLAPLLERLLEDPETQGRAEDAFDHIAMFASAESKSR